jgi:D-arginine dehydrogenase
MGPETKLEPRKTQRQVVIVGGGIAGIATAWGLAEGGDCAVTLLEREAQLASHSTAKNASILRTLTGETASTTLALETAEFLTNPPGGFTDLALLDPVGLILLPARPDAPALEEWSRRKPAGAVQALNEPQLRELCPHFRGRAEGALLVRDEGHIDNAALIDGMLRQARRAGVRIRTGAEVTELLQDDSGITGVQLAGGDRLKADVVALATGGWAGLLASRAGSEMTFEARRRHLLVTAPQHHANPRWPILWSERENFYVRPESGGLMVCACDQDLVDPDHCNAREEVKELIAERSAQCLRGFDDAPVAHFWAGMRTFARDEEFAIGYDPDVSGLFWAAALGGHGMSTSVGIGRLAARLIRREPTSRQEHAAFDPARFARASRT